MKLETTFHILKLPTIEFFQTLLYVFFFLSKSSIQHMSLNFLMGSAETGNKTSASKLQVGSKHSHHVFQIIKLEAKVLMTFIFPLECYGDFPENPPERVPKSSIERFLQEFPSIFTSNSSKMISIRLSHMFCILKSISAFRAF